MIGKNKELHDYVAYATGISRVELNVMAAIGVVIFGWLLGAAYERLGKRILAWGLVIALIVLLIWSGVARSEVASLLVIVLYIAAWVYANMILSRYEAMARQRVAEIDQESSPTTNDLLEKGVLLHKVLRQNDRAREALKPALAMQGGDSFLWYLGGVALSNVKSYPEALAAFDRAAGLWTDDEFWADDKIMKQIKKHRKVARKKLP
jgi:tetratricopeptide (TPR) repeat protein